MNMIERYVERMMAESTPEKPLWNIEKIEAGVINGWNYIDGCMMIALLNLHRITGEARYYEFAEHFLDHYVFEDGSLLGFAEEEYNLDNICEGRVLFELYKKTGKEKYRLAIEKQKAQLDGQPRTNTQNFWHKLIYPHQIWLDGIYMAQVFSTLYSKEYGGKDYSDMLNQIKNVNKYMQDKTTGLYYHGLDCSKSIFWADKESGLSKNFWLRSIGWFTVALVDIIEIIDDEEARGELARIFADLIKSITAFRDPSGLYWQVVDQPGRQGNYLETSGSSMIAYAMLKGARLGVIEPHYAALGKATFDGICNKYLTVNEDGELNLGGICLVAGLGPENNPRRDGSYEYYISEPVVENDAKGVAPFVLCYTEILRTRG